MKSVKNIVVTGGNNGIGFETVKALYLEGHNVIFGSRSVAKNEEAIKEITQVQGGSVISFPLDLSVKKSVLEFSKKVQSQFKHIDILINNAGVLMTERKVNQDGIQMTLAVNHFGSFYLTFLLWDLLKKAPETRIINVSSDLHKGARDDYLEDIECAKKEWTSLRQYDISKIFNVLFTSGLNNLISKNGLTTMKTASLHPGIVDTGFGTGTPISCLKKLCCCFVLNVDEGARTSLYLSRVSFSQIKSGQYYGSNTKIDQMDKRGRNMKDISRLWQMSQKIYGIKWE